MAKKFHINHQSFAKYAERAIVQIHQDVLTTYNFVEWIGETHIYLSPPQNTAQWASATLHWYQPYIKCNHLTATLNTSNYELKLKQKW